jgi:mono/diheme cytochrome c family protein
VTPARWFAFLLVLVVPALTEPTPIPDASAQTSRPSTSLEPSKPLPARLDIGRPASPAEIAAWDIDVGPDGRGLPDGRGTPSGGERIYAERCAACHGKSGTEGPADILVGREPREGFPFGRDPNIPKTIGNYWPYATTLFDYVRRAMPANAPGSLRDADVYDVVAYLLFRNEIIPSDAVVDRTSLPKVTMPARDRFVVDPRGGPRQKP